MKIYTLLYHEDPIDDTSSSKVLNAFTTQEEAHAAMKGKLQEKTDELEVTEGDIDCGEVVTYIDGTDASLCHYGSYYSWTIQEFEI